MTIPLFSPLLGHVTPPKTKTSPETSWLEDYIPFEMVPLFRGTFVLPGCARASYEFMAPHFKQVWDCGTWAEAAKLKSGRRAEPKDGCRTVVGDDVIREFFK